MGKPVRYANRLFLELVVSIFINGYITFKPANVFVDFN